MTAGPTNQVFYPSCVVNFRLRFDEALQVQEIPGVVSPLPSGGIVDPETDIVLPTVRPLVLQNGQDNLSYIVNRVPRSASVELPAYRQAGKFSLEFDWRELPIDPRLLRAIGVEIYLGAVDPGDFATGMVSVDATGRRRSILSTQDASGAPREDLAAMVGLVDNWAVTHNEKSVVKIDGRDLRGVFLDSPINPVVVGNIDLTMNLIEVIAAVLRSHPASQNMKILYCPDDWPTGEPPSCADVEGMTRVRQGATQGPGAVPNPNSQKAGGKVVDEKQNGGISGGTASEVPNFWDIITKYCFLVGAIPFFRGHNLVIRPSRALFDQSKPSGQQPSNATQRVTAFADRLIDSGTNIQQTQKTWDPVFGGNGSRLDDDGKPFYTRKFVFGRNVKELSFERKFTGTKVPVVEVVSYDTSSKNRGSSKLLIAQWPPMDATIARMSGVSPSGEVSQTDKIQVPVPGVTDVARLTAIARSLYEEIGRGELGGACKTGFLASFKGTNADPDILRLRPGHAVEFAMDTRQLTTVAPPASTELALERSPFEQAVLNVRRALKSTDENLARAIVASSRSAVVDLLQTFRTANVIFTWSQDAGIQTSFDFQNYLVTRHDVNTPLGPNTSPSVTSAVARKPGRTGPVNATPQQKKFVAKAINSLNKVSPAAVNIVKDLLF